MKAKGKKLKDIFVLIKNHILPKKIGIFHGQFVQIVVTYTQIGTEGDTLCVFFVRLKLESYFYDSYKEEQTNG